MNSGTLFLALVGLFFSVGAALAQGVAATDSISGLALHLALEHWWCAIGAFGGLLYGYYRLPFVHAKPNKPATWRTMFRIEVAAVAGMFTAALMTAFVQAEWYPKAISIIVVAPISGMAAPLFYDYIWRPGLWPFLTKLWAVITDTIIAGIRSRVSKLVEKVLPPRPPNEPPAP